MPFMSETAGAKLERLLDIMRTLRGPGGCPWDREQTLGSLRPFVLEETYEVLEAIESGTPADLCEELGDFLFEAVFLSQISEEQGHFSIGDAIDAICDKLVRRHPHVFAREGDGPALTSGEVIERWETLKARERATSGASPKRKTTLSGVPVTLPSLLRAYEISSRAAAVGFDWVTPGDVVTKIEEEVAELRHEVSTGAIGDLSRAEEEMGDLLFSIVNLSRKLGIEPEAALRRANHKFTTRFEAMEETVGRSGRSLSDLTLDDLETVWNRVKDSKIEKDTKALSKHNTLDTEPQTAHAKIDEKSGA
jgi:MazG family protein